MLAFAAPVLDWHALAPEVVLVAVITLMIVVDVVGLDRARGVMSTLAGLGLLGALIPLLTLGAADGDLAGSGARSMFGGAYVVDSTSVLLKALFLVAGFVIVLLSTNYVADGENAQEFVSTCRRVHPPSPWRICRTARSTSNPYASA